MEMAEISDTQKEAPNMADLLEYFEARSRSLDDEGLPILDASTLQFISLIKFNGIPILPPVLTESKREEMQKFKHAALKIETKARTKRREDMHTKVQSIVAGVEERRAAKQAEKSKGKMSPSEMSRASVNKDVEETLTRLSSTKSISKAGESAPPEIVINVPATKKTSKSSSALSTGSGVSKSKSSNYKSLGKLGMLNKQKSLSSQHLERSTPAVSQSNIESEKSTSPKSQNSRGLYPHPPEGRPPSKGSSLRQSASTPDLRNIDINVEPEDLKKAFSSRSLSPKGGRPQTLDMQHTSPKFKECGKVKERERDGKKRTEKKSLVPDSSESHLPNNADKRNSKTSAVKKPTSEKMQLLRNPLETLEKELVKQEEADKRKIKAFSSSETDVDPIQAAAAELFPYPISEEEALATLDSLQADFASLEQIDSLPNDYNGIPLNSVKEQQIIHMLTKLSKALNIEDTLASTTSSNNTSNVYGGRDNKHGHTASVQYNKSDLNGAIKGFQGSDEPNEIFEDGSINVTSDTSVTGHSVGSAGNISTSSRGQMSPTGSSILSSASSIGASRSRMSPKSLKNTVHFSSFVTEISTSASQSYEDKISIRKLDITPKNSENFEENECSDSKNVNSSRSGLGPGTSYESGSLLNKVALSPSIDSTSGSPGEHQGQDHPLNQSSISQDGELNTSDKENEFSPSVHDSSNDSYQNARPSSRTQQVLNIYSVNIPEGPIGEYHPAVVKTSVKSNTSESSTLKEYQEKVLTEENLSKYSSVLEAQYCYNKVSKDLDIYSHGLGSSTSSMQEEITRSYLMQQNKPEKALPIKKKQDLNSIETDDVSFVLQPVLPHNCQNSLNVNRSMLEDEDQIRSNLQRVLLEDSDNDSIVYDSNQGEKELNDREDSVICENYDAIDENARGSAPNKDVIRIDRESMDHSQDTQGKEVEDESRGESVVDTAVTVQDKNNINDTNSDNDDCDIVQTKDKQDKVEVKEVQAETEEIEETEEEEGKAEHIQKYLIHVHEQSMHLEDKDHDPGVDDVKSDSDFDIASLIHSFTSSLQNMNHLSQEDLFRIQAEQFELLQKKLIEQQRAQLEELFVSQRREQLALEKEIESYQHKIQGHENRHESIETISLPDTQRVPTSSMVPDPNHAPQYLNQVPYSENQTLQITQTSYPSQTALPVQPSMAAHHPMPVGALSPPFPIQPVPTMLYQQNLNTSIISHNTSYSTIPYSDIHTALPLQQGQGLIPKGYDVHLGHFNGLNFIPTQNSTVPSMPCKNQSEDVPKKASKRKLNNQSALDQSGNPYIYPASPSLIRNPADRDDASDVSSFVRATPKQLVFSNQSTPVPVPKISIHRPVMHSPTKKPSKAWQDGRLVIPEKVFDPGMKSKFDRVSAAVKGYLTRRLLRAHKVQEIITTINDTRNFAFSFQAETPIKQGTFTKEDRILLERIVAQLQAALLDIHEIFFIIPISERMAIISSSRQMEQDHYLRDSKRSSLSVTQSQSQPKLSKATLKARERKKMAQLAEEAVFRSAEFRPKSAPPKTSSPHPSTDIRALRPLQGQVSPIRPDSQITVREMKERPKSATEKVKVKATVPSNKTKKITGGTKTAKTSNKQQKTATINLKSKKMDKAWR